MSLLHSRTVDVSPTCPRCHMANETIFHALVGCPAIRDVWRFSVLGGVDVQICDFVDWWNYVLSHYSVDVCCNSTMLIWQIWFARNDLV